MAEHFGLLLTGAPGVGKTTVIRRVAKRLSGRRLCGFTTEEIRRGGERVGFRLRTFDGKEDILAHVSIRSGPRVGKYGVDLDALDRIVDEALDLSTRNAIVLVDEIGKMECYSEKFVRAIEKLIEERRRFVATVGQRGGGLIRGVKEAGGLELWTVKPSNREKMPDRVVEWLTARADG